MSLSLNVSVFPVSINGKRNDYKIKNPFTKKDKYPNIEIYYETNTRFKKIKDSNILFTYNEIKDNSQLYFSNWFHMINELKPMIVLYLGNLYNSETYIQFHFLSLAQALEFYHRMRFEGHYLKAEKFQELHTSLSESITEILIISTLTTLNC